MSLFTYFLIILTFNKVLVRDRNIYDIKDRRKSESNPFSLLSNKENIWKLLEVSKYLLCCNPWP